MKRYYIKSTRVKSGWKKISFCRFLLSHVKSFSATIKFEFANVGVFIKRTLLQQTSVNLSKWKRMSIRSSGVNVLNDKATIYCKSLNHDWKTCTDVKVNTVEFICARTFRSMDWLCPSFVFNFRWCFWLRSHRRLRSLPRLAESGFLQKVKRGHARRATRTFSFLPRAKSQRRLFPSRWKSRMKKMLRHGREKTFRSKVSRSLRDLLSQFGEMPISLNARFDTVFRNFERLFVKCTNKSFYPFFHQSTHFYSLHFHIFWQSVLHFSRWRSIYRSTGVM